MKRKITILTLCAMLLVFCSSAQGRETAKIAKVGELVSFRRGSSLGTGRELFRRSLNELGYVEGKSILFETRSAEGKLDRLPALADELVRLKVDVLVASSPDEVRAFKSATSTIPVVFLAQGDPVELGIVDSLARPGGNITGITTFASVLGGKRIELLKETVPKLSRVAVLWNPRGSGEEWKQSRQAARELGLQFHSMEVSSVDKFDSAFKEALKAGSAAIGVTQNPLVSSDQKQIVALATQNRLPTIYPRGDYVESGGLMSYGADRAEPYKRAAVMVDKILKGAKPADLPVEQPKKFEFIINLKAAKQIRLTIPPNVLARADKVIR